MLKIGFLGGGNMARAIIAGLTASGAIAESIAVMDRHPEKLSFLQKTYGVQPHSEAGAWIADLDVVVLAVKPQGLKACCEQVAEFLSPQSTVLSIAAAVPSAAIAGWLHAARVVRAMPNTPAMVSRGMTGLYAGKEATSQDRSRAEDIMRTVGSVVWVTEEDELHLVTAGPGSGPAYVFLFMEAFAEALRAEGLEAETAREFALSTVQGAAALARTTGEPFSILRRNVTSKGGTTARAIEALEAHDLRGALLSAVKACRARSIEMSSLFS